MRLIAVLTPFFCYLLAKLLNDLYGSNLLAVSVFVGVAFILNWHAFSFLLQSFLESCAPPSKYEAELVGLKKNIAYYETKLEQLEQAYLSSYSRLSRNKFSKGLYGKYRSRIAVRKARVQEIQCLKSLSV